MYIDTTRRVSRRIEIATFAVLQGELDARRQGGGDVEVLDGRHDRVLVIHRTRATR